MSCTTTVWMGAVAPLVGYAAAMSNEPYRATPEELRAIEEGVVGTRSRKHSRPPGSQRNASLADDPFQPQTGRKETRGVHDCKH